MVMMTLMISPTRYWYGSKKKKTLLARGFSYKRLNFKFMMNIYLIKIGNICENNSLMHY